MSSTLKRRGDHFRWKFDAWETVLQLAEEHGWKPAGTQPPRGIRKAGWDAADYVSCSRQQVTADDASAMAAALAKALTKISSNPNKRPPRGASPGLKEFWGWSREGLEDFTDYCKRGAFRVTDDPYEQ